MSSQTYDFGAQVQVISTLCTETSYAKLGEDLGLFCAKPSGRALAVDFTNVHIVAMRDSDEEFRLVTDTMDIFVPDSTVLTWAVNFRGGRMKDRVYGPGFLTHMIEHTPPHLTHYFLGGSKECLDRLLANIRAKNPNLKIVGSRNGYFNRDDEADVLAGINKVSPDLVWIGLGTPKQQEWIHRFKRFVNARALLAVGFAFDVNAGTKKDAPVWMQKAGLTWFYRLTQEPSRLWARYLVYNSMFIRRLGRQVYLEGLNGRQTFISSELGIESLRVSDLSKDDLENRRTDYETSKESEQRSNVMGVGISPISLEEASRRVVEAASEQGEGRYVTVTGVHGVMESQRDPDLMRIHNSSFLSTPDGMPMVWMGRWNGFSGMTRVYGPDLMLSVAQASAAKEQKHYFFGGKEGVARELGTRLADWFPGLANVGSMSPPFRPLEEQEEDSLVEKLNQLQPHYLWVGLSTPKQERFMADLLRKYPTLSEDWPHRLVMLGVGAAFDFHTGRLAQAPRWMQNSGLEWFFRLLMEPRRLFKRYSINNFAFILGAFQQMTGRRYREIQTVDSL